jgi:hypothetical protein
VTFCTSSLAPDRLPAPSRRNTLLPATVANHHPTLVNSAVSFRRTRACRALILVAGIILIQFILFGPSLIGRKILLPMDVLTRPACYLSPTEAVKWGPPLDPILSDPVLEFEIERRFAVSEIRAGRLPLWDPHEYCGAPFLAANWSCVFSPFRVLDYFWPGPFVIAWDELLKSLVAGIGTYFFCRRVLEAGIAPALIGAWLWPLCAYYIQWAGSPESAAATWLPWIFLFTDQALRRPRGFGGIGLALVTTASLLSGHAETTGQILLADGVFFVWRLFDLYGLGHIASRAAVGAILGVLGGWLVGLVLSAPQSLPTIEYLRNSHRVVSRLSGAPGSETPTAGPSALPQLVIPYFNGSTRRNSYYIGASGNLNESASTGYVGLLTALCLAPLAIADRRRRSMVIFFAVLAVLGLGQVLGLPPLKQIYDEFPLNLMRENRLVFFTGWAIAMCAVIGLDSLRDQSFRWSQWFWTMAAVVIALGAWCIVRAASAPEHWQEFLKTTQPRDPAAILNWFQEVYISGAILCAIALLTWLALWRGVWARPWFFRTVALLAIAEVVAFDYNAYPQTDPQLYYPPQPMLQYLANASPGRVCAVHCLPACLPEIYWLYDVRGYDGIDPSRLIDLCVLTQPNLLRNSSDEGGVLQDYYPRQLVSPITNLMNLRYLILPGKPAVRHPQFVTDGYWLVENRQCLPRAFIPRHVKYISDFDPADVAFVESPVPHFDKIAQGTVNIVSELPSHLTLEFNMQSPGMIVLSDLFFPGWKARVNGVQTPVIRADHAFRGVIVPSGKGTLQFDYEPESFYGGVFLAFLSATALLTWAGLSLKLRNPKSETRNQNQTRI